MQDSSQLKGWTTFETNLGRCGIAWEGECIARFCLPERSAGALASILKDGRSPKPSEPPAAIQEVIHRAVRHLAGNAQDFRDVGLSLDGVPVFHRQVYYEALRIAAGEVITYGELATRVGKPGAARAVGQALGKNPIPLIVPCHRIVSANRRMGGFSAYGGVATKRKLLEIEGINLSPPVRP